MKRKLFLAFAAFILFFHYAVASFDDSLIVGTWKGTSICQIKSSPCHDEIAVYHIQKGEKSGTFRIVGNKMVNGKEEDMGILDCTLDPSSNLLTCNFKSSESVWQFKITGRKMDGTLYVRGQLYRIIKLTKESSS